MGNSCAQYSHMSITKTNYIAGNQTLLPRFVLGILGDKTLAAYSGLL